VEEFEGFNFEKSEEEFNKIWSDFLPEPVSYEDFNVDEALLNFEDDTQNKALAMMNIEGQDPVLSSIPATMSVIGEDQVQFSLMDDIFGGVELPMTSSPDEVLIEDVMETHDYCKPATSSSPRASSPILMTRAVALANPLPEPKMSKRQVKPRKRFDESEDDEDDDSDFEVKPKRKAGSSKTVKRLTSSGLKNKSTNDPDRKLKLWEIETPFDDPAEEQKRLNAINAKKNRDIKKKQKQSMEKKMTVLRQSNDKLQKKYSKSRQRLTAIEAQLQAIVSIIGRDQIDSMLKSSGNTDLPKYPIEIEYEDGLSSSEDDDESAIEYGSDDSE